MMKLLRPPATYVNLSTKEPYLERGMLLEKKRVIY